MFLCTVIFVFGESFHKPPIVILVEIINKAHDTDKYVVGVLLHPNKALDTVYHNVLLEKYHNCQSEKKQLTHGVRKGSIPGPLDVINMC